LKHRTFPTRNNPEYMKKREKREEFHPEMWYTLITAKNHTKQNRRDNESLPLAGIKIRFMKNDTPLSRFFIFFVNEYIQNGGNY